MVGGIYTHFKGSKVRVLFEALDSETVKPVVVYIHLGDDGRLWVRSKEMFLEDVTRDGKTFERFSLFNNLVKEK